MNITHAELRQIADDFLEENYDLKLEVPILFNTRLKRCLGRMMSKVNKLTKEYTPVKIELSVDFLKNHPKDQIIDVLKHELVHYALCKLGKPFSDGHPYFENELKRLGISATRTLEFLGESHIYECKDCGSVFKRRRKMPPTSYCSCSNLFKDNLVYKGVKNAKELVKQD